MSNDPVILRADQISRTYPGSVPVHALKPCSLTLQKGTFTAVVGKSGSGKSTLLRILGTLDPSDTGTLTIEGREICRLGDAALSRFRRRRIGFIHQDYDLFPEYTAYENAVFPLHLDSKTEDRKKTEALFEQLGLTDCLNKFPHEMSGGEQQRVAIARALAASPALILADEPTGNLDAANAERVAGILSSLVDTENVTVVMVTHDASLAAAADRVIRISNGVLEA
ncbi:MAG: ABC transporter ATP-binding protein [Clostridia bacterium]|nr:ABC transporter ATP-binding protein [Clostridia bacterium]